MHKPTKKKRPFLGRIPIAGATIIIRSKKDYDRKKEKKVDILKEQ